jgi:hypothetical protein
MSERSKMKLKRNPLFVAIGDLNRPELKAWLHSALAGDLEGMPVGPDDLPHHVILRHEGDLPNRNRDDLSKACLELLHDFARKPVRKRNYTDGLFYLALGLKVEHADLPLQSLAMNKGRLMRLPYEVRAGVLTTLSELQPGMDPEFWRRIFTWDPKDHATITFSALARHSLESAVRFLAEVDDRSEFVETIRMLLELKLERVNADARSALADAFAGVIRKAGKRLKAALREVCGEFEIPLVREVVVAKPQLDLSGLDLVLKAVGISPRQPKSLRLLAA